MSYLGRRGSRRPSLTYSPWMKRNRFPRILVFVIIGCSILCVLKFADEFLRPLSRQRIFKNYDDVDEIQTESLRFEISLSPILTITKCLSLQKSHEVHRQRTFAKVHSERRVLAFEKLRESFRVLSMSRVDHLHNSRRLYIPR